MIEAPERDPVAKALQAMAATREAAAQLTEELLAELTPAERAAWARLKARKSTPTTILDQ